MEKKGNELETLNSFLFKTNSIHLTKERWILLTKDSLSQNALGTNAQHRKGVQEAMKVNGMPLS